jgi:hypothetical protein
MSRPILFLCLVSAFIVVPEAFAQDEAPPAKKQDPKPTEKKPTPNPTVTPKPETKPKMVTVAQPEGKVLHVDTESKTLVLELVSALTDGRNLSVKRRPQKFTLANDVQVYWQQRPVELDEKGRPKKVNPKDLKKPVKGPSGLYGFPTELDTLRKEQLVIAVVQQPQATKKPGVKKSTDDESEANKPAVTAVYIVFEPKR